MTKDSFWYKSNYNVTVFLNLILMKFLVYVCKVCKDLVYFEVGYWSSFCLFKGGEAEFIYSIAVCLELLSGCLEWLILNTYQNMQFFLLLLVTSICDLSAKETLKKVFFPLYFYLEKQNVFKVCENPHHFIVYLP